MRLFVGLALGFIILGIVAPLLVYAFDIWLPQSYERTIRPLSHRVILAMRNSFQTRDGLALRMCCYFVLAFVVVASVLVAVRGFQPEASLQTGAIYVLICAIAARVIASIPSTPPGRTVGIRVSAQIEEHVGSIVDKVTLPDSSGEPSPTDQKGPDSNMKWEAAVPTLAGFTATDSDIVAATAAFQESLREKGRRGMTLAAKALSTLDDHRYAREQITEFWDVAADDLASSMSHVRRTKKSAITPTHSVDLHSTTKWLVEIGRSKEAAATWARVHQPFFQELAKRLADALLSAILLLLVFPVIAFIVTTMVVLRPETPPFYASFRYGRFLKPFTLYHFRIPMNRLPDGTARPSKIGSFLLRTGFYALPELINVLQGDMSLVGPRPLSAGRYRLLWDAWRIDSDALLARVSVRPGWTGPAQLHSLRATASCEQYIEMDLEYIRSLGPRKDISILTETLLLNALNLDRLRISPDRLRVLVQSSPPS